MLKWHEDARLMSIYVNILLGKLVLTIMADYFKYLAAAVILSSAFWDFFFFFFSMITDELSNEKMDVQHAEGGFHGTLLTANTSSQVV